MHNGINKYIVAINISVFRNVKGFIMLEAMEEYAQQQSDERAMEFANWIRQNNYVGVQDADSGERLEFWANNASMTPLSASELLTKFKTETNR